MSAAVTRRGLVQAAGAALGAVTLPAVGSALASPAGGDAGLFDLIRRHGEAMDAVHAATAAAEATSRAALDALPPSPDALRWRPGDFARTSYGIGITDREDGGGARHYGLRAVRWLREREPFPAWAARVGAAMTAEEAEACEARRLEILTAWDAHQAERWVVEDRVGHTDALQAEEDAAGDAFDLVMEIKRARPVTLAGLRALAAWFGRQVEADDLHDDFLQLLAGTVAAFGGAKA